jgi:predicted nuclease of predicted toxin-antitoxin system
VLWRLLIDEDLSPQIAYSLATAGIDATSVRDRGRLGDVDWVILRYCTADQRAIITANARDFEKLAADWQARGEDHAGILIVAGEER